MASPQFVPNLLQALTFCLNIKICIKIYLVVTGMNKTKIMYLLFIALIVSVKLAKWDS